MTAQATSPVADRNGEARPAARGASWVRRGGVIMVAGPDGCGKTTLAHGLAQTVFADVPVLQVHHRRGIGKLPGRKPQGPTTDPHRHEPYSAFVSVAKLVYLFVDFSFGWRRTIRPFVRSGGWVILQRDWWDLLVDPRRYRLRPMPRLAAYLGRLLPEPDLTLILEAEPGVIRARKAELPVEELARQRAVWRAVRPPGESRAYIDASQPAAAVQKQAGDALARRMSGRRASREAAGWLAFPPMPDARWLLPRNPRAIARAGLDVYQPVTIRGRIGWESARALASLGMLRALPECSAPPRAVRDLIDPYVPAGGAFAVARTNHPGRCVALILGADGGRVAVAKIADDAEGQAALAREADNLERFGNLLSHPLSAPRVLGRSEGALVVEAVRWRPRWRPWRLPEDVAFALGAFFRAGPGAAASGARTGLSHGDVAPWNLLRTDRAWVLIDWEDARTARPPFYDLMHFLAQSATLLGRPSVRALAKGVAQKEGWIGAAVAAYARGAQLSADDAWPMLLAYLRDNIEDHDRRQLLETLTSQPREHVLTR